MGNIIVSQRTVNQWREESRTAQRLLQILPINKQEEQLLDSVKRETKFKMIMALLLSATFCASVRRYFPDSVLIESNFVYGCTCASILIPTFTVISVYSNKEIVSRLTPMKNNHDILNS